MIEELKFIPSFEFKGDRNYVHGTSIVSYLQESREINELGLALKSIKFISTISKQPLIYVLDPIKYESLKASHQIAFEGKLSSFNEKDLSFALIGLESNVNITSCVLYNEAKITKDSLLQDDTISLSRLSGYLFIEEVVALMKYYCNHVKPPKANSKWLFTGIEFLAPLPLIRDPDLCITLINFQFLGSSFVKAKLYYDHKLLGGIHFTVSEI